MTEGQPAHHLPVSVAQDPGDDSNDSAYGDDVLSDTTSVASSIMQHRFEHGRRYHKFKEGAYWGPNDDAQNDQLDLGYTTVQNGLFVSGAERKARHHMLRLLIDDKLYLAPITDNPQKVLDLGCGTGIWAIDFADQFPDCEVLGTDLSPTQPQFAPPNCRFEIDDMNDAWTYARSSFDMVNLRCLFGCVSDWPRLYREVYDHLKPGAWINQMEISIEFKSDDGTAPPGSVLPEWSKLFIETMEDQGKTMLIADKMKQWIADAGFEEVTEVRHKVPVGPWSADPKMKEIGKWNLLYCYHGCEGWALYTLIHALGWKYEEVMVYVAKFKQALKDKSIHAYYEIPVVYGRKPLVPTTAT